MSESLVRHTAEASFGTEWWYASCECGWYGPRRSGAASANADAIEHNEPHAVSIGYEVSLDSLGIVPFQASDHAIADRSGFYMKAPCGKVGLLGGCTVQSRCQECQS